MTDEILKPSFGAKVWDNIKTIFYALLIAGVFRTLLFQPFYIPSGSMKDNLLIGDFLFVNKMSYGYSYASCPSIIIPAWGLYFGAEKFCGVFDGDNGRLFGATPERGDVVVFRHPTTGTDYVKRLIGLPGDKVQLRNGMLFLNGTEIPREQVEDFREPFVYQGIGRNRPRCVNRPTSEEELCDKLRFRETLPNAKSYTTLDAANQTSDNTPVFTVPEGHFFFLGDNRDNSTDSRFDQRAGGVGFVPYENLIGRASLIVFSSAGRSLFQFWTWRSDRFFKAVE